MDDIGYEIERFPGLNQQVLENLSCSICTLVVRQPKECSNCRSLFCGVCIEHWLMTSKVCPKKGCDLKKFPLNEISRALLIMYNNLDIKCKYPNCKTIKKIVDIDKHEQTCQTKKCINFELCGNSVKEDLKAFQVCDLSCLLLSKIKPHYGKWDLVHKEIQSFVKENLKGAVPKKLPSLPNFMTPEAAADLTDFRWDHINLGENITLSENNTRVFLKESGYLFRTVLGTQGFVQGIHYWEIHADPLTDNELKIGVALNKAFNVNSAFCDYEFGYAYYGVGQLRHNSNSLGASYGEKFKASGVLGVCLNMFKGTLSFALDGKYWGVAFQNEELKKGPAFPAVALLHCAGCKLVTRKPVPACFL